MAYIFCLRLPNTVRTLWGTLFSSRLERSRGGGARYFIGAAGHPVFRRAAELAIEIGLRRRKPLCPLRRLWCYTTSAARPSNPSRARQTS